MSAEDPDGDSDEERPSLEGQMVFKGDFDSERDN